MDKVIGNIVDIFISDTHSKQRLQCNKIKLDTQGIIKDKFYNRNTHRSVLITSLESYDLLESHSISIDHGMLGENLLIDYNPYKLEAGSILEIGTVHLEISQYCTICNHLSSIDPKVPKLLKEDRGIFAKVIKAGDITKNDRIALIKK